MTTRRSGSLPTAPRPVGRPRSGEADAAILDAATALLAEHGVNGLTISAVVKRSGVARATVYRRYPTREALTAAALSRVKGGDPFPLTGDVVADIATGVEQAAAIFGLPAFRRVLPAFVAEALGGPAAARALIQRVAPNHHRIAEEYAETAGSAGLRTDIDPSLVSDVVQGTMLMRLLSSGRTASAEAQAQLISILERGLRPEERP